MSTPPKPRRKLSVPVVGMHWPLSGLHFERLLDGVLSEAEELGCNVELHDARHLYIAAAEGSIDGFIAVAKVDDTHDANELSKANQHIPCVNISNRQLQPEEDAATSVFSDDYQVGVMAAEYFLGLGFKRFAFTELRDLKFSMERKEGYRTTLAAHGYDVVVPQPQTDLDTFTLAKQTLELILKEVKPPIACFVPTDERAFRLLGAAHHLDVSIPEELAILGVDNDTVVTRLMRPRISSIELASFSIGRTAMRKLVAMHRGEPTARETKLAPLRVVERASSRLLAVDDRRLRAVLSEMRGPHMFSLDINTLCERHRMNRKAMERLFRQHLRCTPLEELRRLRLAVSREALAQSSLSIAQVSEHLGYDDPKHFSMAFRSTSGESPRAYRRRIFGLGS